MGIEGKFFEKKETVDKTDFEKKETVEVYERDFEKKFNFFDDVMGPHLWKTLENFYVEYRGDAQKTFSRFIEEKCTKLDEKGKEDLKKVFCEMILYFDSSLEETTLWKEREKRNSDFLKDMPGIIGNTWDESLWMQGITSHKTNESFLIQNPVWKLIADNYFVLFSESKDEVFSRAVKLGAVKLCQNNSNIDYSSKEVKQAFEHIESGNHALEFSWLSTLYKVAQQESGKGKMLDFQSGKDVLFEHVQKKDFASQYTKHLFQRFVWLLYEGIYGKTVIPVESPSHQKDEKAQEMREVLRDCTQKNDRTFVVEKWEHIQEVLTETDEREQIA